MLREPLAAIDSKGLNDAERLMLDKKMRAFRQAGVDRDEKTREKVRDLISKITELGTQFDKNIREDTRYIQATKAHKLCVKRRERKKK